MPEQEKHIAIRLNREELRARDAAERDGQFLAPAVERALGPLFAGVERDMDQLAGEDIVHSLNRGNLIAIDGRTVRSMMEERYQGPKEDFPFWYKDNLSAMTGEFVSAALHQGRRVEALVPDSRGNLSGEPVQIAKEGAKPEPLRPVSFNRVQRFLGRLGFLKGREERAAAYERAMSGRERLKANCEQGKQLAVKAAQRRAAAMRSSGAQSLQRTASRTAAASITAARRTFKPTRGQQLLREAAMAKRAREAAGLEPPKPKLTNAQRVALVREGKIKRAQDYIRRKEQPRREAEAAKTAAPVKAGPAARRASPPGMGTTPRRPPNGPARRTPNGPIRRPPNGPSKDLGGRTM